MQGWIKLHRGLMKSETFSKLTAIQQLIAIYIILNANHEDGLWYDKYKNVEVPIKRGQLIVSRNKIVNEWFKGDKEITEQKVRTTLKKLERLSFLTITSTSNYTVLEVLNYNVYQAKENETNQVDNQELTKKQPSINQVLTTNKNDKNDKNDKKKDIYRQFKHLVLTKKEFEKLISEEYTKEAIDDILDQIENYKKNKNYTSLYLTARNWLKKSKGKANTSERRHINATDWDKYEGDTTNEIPKDWN